MVKHSQVAQMLGRDESTISRWASEDMGIKLSDIGPFLAAVGLKVVDSGKVCVDRSVYESYKTLAVKALTDPASLNWEDE